MAYYKKEDIRKYIDEKNSYIENKGHKSITPVEHSIMQLDNEEDIVGFFWMDINENVDGAKVKMEGKTFMRIDFNLYTDDRFAIDLYQSQMEGKTVSEIIKNREIDQERAKKTIQENKDDLENEISKKLKKEK
ncbi:MAG: hypothetical protein WC466_02180 [Candidatus Izemoplasmatales bacterium]